MSLSFCRTRTTDKSKHMSHTHAAARSFDLARHPSRCETVELSNREVLDSSTVSQQQHGAKRHCVGFLTTQAFYPPPPTKLPNVCRHRQLLIKTVEIPLRFTRLVRSISPVPWKAASLVVLNIVHVQAPTDFRGDLSFSPLVGTGLCSRHFRRHSDFAPMRPKGG